MYGTLKRLSFIVMLLSGMAALFITLGTLNGRMAGGLTLQNVPWAIAVAVFAVSAVATLVLKILGPVFSDTEPLH